MGTFIFVFIIVFIFYLFNSTSKKKPTSVKKKAATTISSTQKRAQIASPVLQPAKEKMILRGTVRSSKCAETVDGVDLLSARFVAFDVETTGLNPRTDRIIQIGAVLFENQKVEKRFTTFVNPHIHIPETVTAINHITDEMVADAPGEIEVIRDLCIFLGDALTGKTPLVAHNATFDVNFLSEMLERNGIDATVSYADTLSLSRQYLVGLPNYKQPTVAAALEINPGTVHRADSDAETCGRILVSLLPAMQRNAEAIAERFARKQPSEEEKGVCAYLVKMLQASGRDTSRLRFEKTGGAINVKHPYPFASFKLPKTKPLYFTIEDRYYTECKLESLPAGNAKNSSYFKITISKLDDIQELSSMLFAGFDTMAKDLPYFYDHAYWVNQDSEVSFQIRNEEISSLIDGYRNYEMARIRTYEEKQQAKIRAAEEKRQQQDLKRIAREQVAAEKARQKEEAKNQMPVTPPGRPVCQYDDNMVLLQTFESVSAAASAVGISPKGIRDAANGRQKHAAGYVWRYKDIEK